jgi:hypothetical protein
MGLLSKNTLVDLSDVIDLDSIKVNIFDDAILVPFIKEASSQLEKEPDIIKRTYACEKIMNWVETNGRSQILSIKDLSKFAAEALQLKGTKRGKVYDITSRKSKDPGTHRDKLYIYFGQMLCAISVILKQDIPNINGFVKVYKDGTFEYCQQNQYNPH